MADFNIRVIVDTSQVQVGTRRVENSLDRVNRSADRLRNTIGRVFTFAAFSAGVVQLLQVADAFTQLQNRIKQVTTSEVQLTAVTNELFRVSQLTRASFQTTAELFTRVSLATTELGLTQRETIKFTESLNKAVILSGASAQEANNGLIQLSQGLASGVVRGDELRSILEQLPAVADVISKQLGITRGALRQFGEQGKITAEVVIEAFRNSADELTEQFAKTIPTLAQAFVVLSGAAVKAFGEFGKATGITSALAQAMIFLANNIEVIVKLLEVLTVVLGVRLAVAGFGVATRAVQAFTLALAANPIGFILTAIVATVAALVAFRNEIKLSSDGLATLADLGTVVFDTVSEAFKGFSELFTDEFKIVSEVLDEFFGDFDFSLRGALNLFARFADAIVGIWLGVFNAIKEVFKGLPDALEEIFTDAINGVVGIVEDGINTIIEAINVVSDFAGLDTIAGVELDRIAQGAGGASRELGNAIADGFTEGLDFRLVQEGVNVLFDKAEEVARKRILAERQRQIAEAASLEQARGGEGPVVRGQVRAVLDDLAKQANLLRLSSNEREIQNELLKIEQQLKLKLNETEKQLLERALELNQELKLQSEVLESIKGPQNELIDQQEALNALYSDGRITLQEFNNEMLNLRLQQAELNIELGEGTFFDGFLLGIERMIQSVRNFTAEAGMLFGDFFQSSSEGFASAIADSIIFGKSFTETIGNAARSALADLLGGLIKLGIQYVINASLGEAASSAATAASLAQAGAVAAAWATPAALTSLASFGANSAPAAAGIASTVALANALSLTGIGGFANGGFVSGPGTARSDSIPAVLSNGEFVVNAQATSRFRPILEQINNPKQFQSGGMVDANGTSAQTPQAAGNGQRDSTPINIINVMDPSVVQDFMASSAGEEVIVNTIERNASSVQQILNNN